MRPLACSLAALLREVTYAIPSTPAFIGADSRLLLSTAGGSAAVAFFATGGVRF